MTIYKIKEDILAHFITQWQMSYEKDGSYSESSAHYIAERLRLNFPGGMIVYEGKNA